MFKYLSAINENDCLTVKDLSNKLVIRRDSILDTLRKKQYQEFIKFEGIGVNRNSFVVSITDEGKNFLKIIDVMERILNNMVKKQKLKKKKKSFFGVLKGIGPFTKEDEKWMEGKHH